MGGDLGDNVLDTGKIGGGDDLGVSDKIVPAYSKSTFLHVLLTD